MLPTYALIGKPIFLMGKVTVLGGLLTFLMLILVEVFVLVLLPVGGMHWALRQGGALTATLLLKKAATTYLFRTFPVPHFPINNPPQRSIPFLLESFASCPRLGEIGGWAIDSPWMGGGDP